MASGRGGCGDDGMHMCPDCNRPQMTDVTAYGKMFASVRGGMKKTATVESKVESISEKMETQTTNLLATCQNATNAAEYKTAMDSLVEILAKYYQWIFKTGNAGQLAVLRKKYDKLHKLSEAEQDPVANSPTPAPRRGR